jgi:type IX secretion system PorP/SprF family membrane protein
MMSLLKKCFACILIFCSLVAMGQNAPAFRQFYFNPFSFNPAFAGIDGYTKVSLSYRKQWLGFSEAPTGTGFSVEYPTSNKISFGFNLVSSEIVALRSTTMQTTFAYRVPLAANHFIFFGLSGILGSNKLIINDSDYTNDPTILSAGHGNFYADANFGVAYEWSGLRAGFALPKLVNQKYFGALAKESSSLAQFRNQLYSVSYKLKASNFLIEPYALYRLSQDFQDWWEATTVLYYKEKVWLGGSYNSTQGLGFFLGIEIKEKFRFGYSYELPSVDKQFISTSSHELQLQIKLGKKRSYKWETKYGKPQEQPKGVEQTEIEPVVSAKELPDTITVGNDPVVVKGETSTPVQPILTKGFYIVANMSEDIEYAQRLRQRLIGLGNSGTQIALNPNDGLNYIYVFYSLDLEECNRTAKQLKRKEGTRSVWILRVD